MSDASSPGAGGRTLALFQVSVLGLFLELLLIRWISTEIRIFAYLQNTVLVVCFLGLGMGCWTCRQPFTLRQVLAPLNILVLLLALPVTRKGLGKISEMLSTFGGLEIWFAGISTSAVQTLFYAFIGLGLTLALMVMIFDIFVPIGRLLGRLLDDHPHTIWAYSVNVAGSLAGIWLFVLLSLFSLPPLVWFVVAALLLGCFLYEGSQPRPLDWALLVSLIPLAFLAGYEPNAQEVWWSPYQKLTLFEGPNTDNPLDGDYVITVNNVGYQGIINLNPEFVRAHPARFNPKMAGHGQYDLPALLHPRPAKLLIVGAGAGNDAAGALRHPRVAAVTAVEIDPVIIRLGRRFHPEKPYDDPRVSVVNDDARAFFANSPPGQFDVIAFGLLDSHTTTAMTNARLDHYVYTRESLQQARNLLRDGGILSVSFDATKPYIADRMASALREVFDGQEPLVLFIPKSPYGWGGVMFLAGNLDAVRQELAQRPELQTQLADWLKEHPVVLTGETPIATDDWPYIYLERPSIPFLYFCLAGLLALLLLRGLRQTGGAVMLREWGRSSWHFFFLGAAFLLLEVQNISKAAVVLGNTWQINAVIISSILILILLANFLVARLPKLPAAPVYGLLIGSCLGLYFVDISQFAFLPYVSRAALVGSLTSLPMLFSGMVFIRSFAAVPRKDTALGANLIGALVGGLLQSVTFVIGVKALLLIVAALYLSALMTRPRADQAVPQAS